MEYNPNKRLGSNGIDEIKRHPYFEGVNWEDVKQKKSPVIKPKIRVRGPLSLEDGYEIHFEGAKAMNNGCIGVNETIGIYS